ncbi:MAG: ATP-binding protein [Euzebya sp.]
MRRNPRLGEALERLRLAEREAIGVDRMFIDMLADGHPVPSIVEDATRVMVTLNGDLVDDSWVAMVSDLKPPERRGDVNSLLLLNRLRSQRWVDIATAAATIQRTEGEAETALAHLEGAVRGSTGALLVIAHPLPRRVRVWTPGPGMGAVLPGLEPEDRERIAMDYAEANGAVTSTIAMTITGVTRPTATADLARLEAAGDLLRRGAGPTAHFTMPQTP